MRGDYHGVHSSARSLQAVQRCCRRSDGNNEIQSTAPRTTEEAGCRSETSEKLILFVTRSEKHLVDQVPETSASSAMGSQLQQEGE